MKAFMFPLLLIISSACFSQSKEATYYFDSNLNIVKKSKAVAKGIGSEINGLFEVKVYDKNDNHLILIVHYTDAGMAEMMGPFTSYYRDGTMENQANYAHGKPVGLWVTWGINNKVSDSIWYSNGLPDSSVHYDYDKTNHLDETVRKNFKDTSEVTTRFDYSGNQLLPDISDTSRTEDNVVVLNPDEEAKFPGGDSVMNSYLQYTFDRERLELLKYGTSGSCRVRFTVDKTGRAANIVTTFCDNKIFAGVFGRAVRDIVWLPATKNGARVKSIKELSTLYYPSLNLKLAPDQKKYFFDSYLMPVSKDDSRYAGKIVQDDDRVELILSYGLSGKKVFEVHFTDSTMQIPDGLFESFYLDGSQNIGGHFVLGRKHGVWVKRDESGKISDSSVYNLGDKMSETVVHYQPDGSLLNLLMIDYGNRKVRNVFFNDTTITADKTVSFDASQNDSLTPSQEGMEAHFPGGEGAWYTYLYQYIQKKAGNIFVSGTCVAKFMVDTSGKVSEVEALTLQGSSLARILIKAIKNGPNWIPATQNGRKVNSYKMQPFTINQYRKY